MFQCLVQEPAPAREGDREVKETLGKDAARTCGSEAPEATDLRNEEDAPPTDRKVGKGALIVRMDVGRGAITQGTRGAGTADGDGEDDSVGGDGTAFKVQ